MKAAITYYKFTPFRAAHFFAQTAHETGGFKAFSENLNYSAQGLQGTFGKYFPGNLEESYARQPEKIANRVYASRMGNGDEASEMVGSIEAEAHCNSQENRIIKHLQII
jgi:predicted chitinase